MFDWQKDLIKVKKEISIDNLDGLIEIEKERGIHSSDYYYEDLNLSSNILELTIKYNSKKCFDYLLGHGVFKKYLNKRVSGIINKFPELIKELSIEDKEYYYKKLYDKKAVYSRYSGYLSANIYTQLLLSREFDLLDLILDKYPSKSKTLCEIDLSFIDDLSLIRKANTLNIDKIISIDFFVSNYFKNKRSYNSFIKIINKLVSFGLTSHKEVSQSVIDYYLYHYNEKFDLENKMAINLKEYVLKYSVDYFNSNKLNLDQLSETISISNLYDFLIKLGFNKENHLNEFPYDSFWIGLTFHTESDTEFLNKYKFYCDILGDKGVEDRLIKVINEMESRSNTDCWEVNFIVNRFKKLGYDLGTEIKGKTFLSYIYLSKDPLDILVELRKMNINLDQVKFNLNKEEILELLENLTFSIVDYEDFMLVVEHLFLINKFEYMTKEYTSCLFSVYSENIDKIKKELSNEKYIELLKLFFNHKFELETKEQMNCLAHLL